jgi:Flp pilus assembly protein TadD
LLVRTQTSTGLVLFLIAISVFAQPPANILQQAGQDMDAGQYPRAETRLLAALEADPDNGSLWFLLGIARAQLKKIDPAIQAFEKALPLAADQAPVYFNLGLLHMQKQDLAQAEDAYHRGLALDSSNAPANQNYAFLLMQQGKFHEALIPLERLKGMTPRDVSVRASLILAYLKSGSKVEGGTEIDDIMQTHVATLAQGLELATLLDHEGDADAGRRVLEALVNSWPASAQAHGELGLILAEKEEFSQASQELSEAVHLDPDSVKYSVAYGEALMRSGQYPAALKFLLTVQNRFGKEPKLRYQLALTHMYLLRFPEATSELDSLARELPDSARVRFLLAGCYEVQGELQKAEESYRKAIQLAPEEPGYYRALGSLLQKQGSAQLGDAMQLLRKALALDPSDADSRVVLASCLEKQGELEQAATLLEQAVGSEPSSRRAHTALAELYLRQRRLDRAEQEQAIAARLEDQKIKEWDVWRPQAAAGP